MKISALVRTLLTAVVSLWLLGGNGCLPVYAQQAENENHILKVFVTTSMEEGSVPLENVILDIYKPSSDEGEPFSEDIARDKKRNNLIGTIMTDKDGYAEFDLSRTGLGAGMYLVCRQENPALSGKPDCCYIRISGSSTLFLEEIPEKPPTIQMDVGEAGQKSGSFDIDQMHNWIIRSSIPSGICNARRYVITDVLDHRLQYERGSVRVFLHDRDGRVVLLDENHYHLLEETQNNNGKTVDVFSVALTPEGMSFIAANPGKGGGQEELRISFRAAIGRNTEMGATIPNDAHLDYCNSAGVGYHTDSDIPEVHTGGIHIFKADREGNPLFGSEFMIAREATQAEMEDETLEKEVLHVNNRDHAVVFLKFLDDDLQGEKHDRAVTDAQGTVAICGLAYGTYYLVEAAASEGHAAAMQPMKIEIHEFSHLTKKDALLDSQGEAADYTVQIINTPFAFPNTGGSGTSLCTSVGFLLICIACLIKENERKKKYGA